MGARISAVMCVVAFAGDNVLNAVSIDIDACHGV